MGSIAKGLLAVALLTMVGCGTREFIIERADHSKAGMITVDRWLEDESVILEDNAGKRTIYDCKWSSHRCYEAK